MPAHTDSGPRGHAAIRSPCLRYNGLRVFTCLRTRSAACAVGFTSLFLSWFLYLNYISFIALFLRQDSYSPSYCSFANKTKLRIREIVPWQNLIRCTMARFRVCELYFKFSFNRIFVSLHILFVSCVFKVFYVCVYVWCIVLFLYVMLSDGVINE